MTQKGALSEQAKMDRFVEKHPDAECHGFFSTKADGRLSCVVLARVFDSRFAGARIECEAIGFTAPTPEELIERALEGGFEIGDVATVREKCEPIYRVPRRRGRT